MNVPLVISRDILFYVIASKTISGKEKKLEIYFVAI